MKKLILALALASTPALAATDIVMHRDPGCGCCEKWAAQVRGGRVSCLYSLGVGCDQSWRGVCRGGLCGGAPQRPREAN